MIFALFELTHQMKVFVFKSSKISELNKPTEFEPLTDFGLLSGLEKMFAVIVIEIRFGQETKRFQEF